MLNVKQQSAKQINDIYKPYFYNTFNVDEKKVLDQLLGSDNVFVYDEIESQLKELIKCRNPKRKLSEQEYKEHINKHLGTVPLNEYGVWAYYPWSSRLVHILDKAEFIELRTNRNKYKITQQEQDLLATKTIGIIGLSVGQSIALTIAMERVCGHLKLADFDTAELSNLNRIRTGVHNLGLNKTVIAAREILEIDPYLDITIFNEGITDTNIDGFFAGLDLLVEVCDGLDIKIISRFKARELKIPVVMDTNDRGMLDVERFDLEPKRPILHGLAGDLDPNKIKGLTNEQKIPYILKMIGAETISTRLKASMMEVEQSINTWPQLASSVTLGGALTTDTCRKILLNLNRESGRFYFDFDEVIHHHKHVVNTAMYDGPPELIQDDLCKIASKYVTVDISDIVGIDTIEAITKAACLAPSGGNAQPWKFLFSNNRLYIYHDAHFSYSLLDYNNTGSYIAFGAMIQNIEIAAASLGFSAKAAIFPLKEDNRLVAVVAFGKGGADNIYKHLSGYIPLRLTNRNPGEKKPLQEKDKNDLISLAATIPGAKLQLFENDADIADFAELLTNTERIRFMHPQGHYDTFVKELRFTPEEIISTADGLDIGTLNMSESDKAALQIARDASAIDILHDLNKGDGFKKISREGVMSAACIGVISMNGHDATHFFNGGCAVQRIWLEANQRGISFQPISQTVFMLERYLKNGSIDFNEYEQEQLGAIHNTLSKLLDLEKGRYPVFIFRLFYGVEPKERALRRPLTKVLFVN